MTGPPPVNLQTNEEKHLIDNTLLQILQSGVETEAKDVARAQMCSCDFVVSVTLFKVSETVKNPQCIIRAGYPPTLLISAKFVSDLILGASSPEIQRKNKKTLRKTLVRAIARLPEMQKTLAIVPIAEAIVLQDSHKRWAKTQHPDNFIYSIPEHHIKEEESYTITVTEINSGIAVTLTGDNPSKLRKQVREKLTKLVSTNEVLQYRIAQEQAEKQTPNPTSLELYYNPIADTEEVKLNFNENETGEKKE